MPVPIFLKKSLLTCTLLSTFCFSDSASWTGGGANDRWDNNDNWTAPFPNGPADVATFPNLSANIYAQFNSLDIEVGSILNENSKAFVLERGSGTNSITINSEFRSTNTSDTRKGCVAPNINMIFADNATIDFSTVDRTDSYLELIDVNLTSNGNEAITFIGPGSFEWTSETNVTLTTLTMQNDSILETSSDNNATINVTNIILDGAGTRIDSQSNNDLASNISGTGSVRCLDSLTFTGNNSYSGGTTINSNITLTGTTSSIPSAGGISNSGTVIFAQTANGTYSGVITGSGALTKTQNGNLSLTGANTYSGATAINAGTLTVNSSSLSPNTTVNNTSTLQFNQTGNGTSPTVITGTGDVIKTGNGNLSLTGANTYSGATTINAGTLTVNTSSISPNTTITNNANFKFNQTSNASFAKAISGAGNVIKSGSGVLTFTTAQPYTGNTSVQGGTLSIAATGSIHANSTTTVSSGTLRGSGSVGPVVNQSTVQAGLAVGETLTVNGNYSQSGNATLTCLLSPTETSQLEITGTAALNGTLNLNIQTGQYPLGTEFTVLTADGGIQEDGLGASTFSNITDNHTSAWELSYTNNSAIITSIENQVITPVTASQLSGNDLSIFNYLFGNPEFIESSSDLNTVANSMLELDATAFKSALVSVTPISSNALPFAGFQNDLQMAIILDDQFQRTLKHSLSNHDQLCPENAIATEEPTDNEIDKAPCKPTLCSAYPKTGVFIEPLGIFYVQEDTQGSPNDEGQIGFTSYTYGAGLGAEKVLDNKWIVEGGVGYTHSNLNWDQNFGNARWSTAYFAPFAGYFNRIFYVNLMTLGAFNFIHNERRIQFPGVERIATSNYMSYDLLIRANSGFRIHFGKGFWFQPDATLNSLIVFTERYREKGAGSLNLEVLSANNYILQPSFRAKFIKEFNTRKFCFAPNIYFGWLANIPLKTQTQFNRLLSAPTQTLFNINGYYKTLNQGIAGFEFYLRKNDRFIFTTNAEADLFSGLEVYIVKLKFQWLF